VEIFFYYPVNLFFTLSGNRGSAAFIILAFFLLQPGTDGDAQTLKRPLYLETRVHSGLNLPFYDAVSFMMRDDIFAFDISAGFPSRGKSYWEKLYRYPSSGAGLSYWTLGNDNVFGRAFALYSFISVPVFKKDDKFSVDCRISAGGSYLTKKFDINNNYLNRAIGSYGNIYIRLGIDGKLKLSPRCNLVLEAGTSHFSNAKTRSPNRGLNFASFSTGISYLISDAVPQVKEPELPDYTRKLFQSVAISAGSKVYDNLLNKKYLVSSLYYNLERSLNMKRRIGAGIALFYDGSIKEALASDESSSDQPFSDLIRFGLHGSFSSQYKHIILGIQAGYYLYSRYTDLTRIYTRFSLQYLITEHIAGFTGIKTHYGKADFLEIGVMYCW